MPLSSNKAKIKEPEDNHWAPSLLDNIVNIYMKIDDWSGLFKVFEFKNICKVLTKSGFIFKHHSRSLYHTIGHAMMAAVMCSFRRNCSIDHAFVEYSLLCSLESVTACSHRTFTRAFTQKAALAKAMHELAIKVGEEFQKEFCKRDIQTFGKKILANLQQIDGNIKRIVAIDGSEICLGREANIGETKGKTKAGRKVHTLLDVTSDTVINHKIGSATSNEKQVAIEMIKNDHNAKGTLWLCDAGYINAKLQQCIVENGGYYLIKSRYNINPLCIDVTEYDVYLDKDGVYKIDSEGKYTKFKQATPLCKLIPSDTNCPVITGTCGNLIGRSYVFTKTDGTKLIMIFNPKNKSFDKDKLRSSWVYFESNLSDAINIETISAIYRLRWQIEIKFLCLKSHNGWDSTSASNYHICDYFVSASIIGDYIKYFVALAAISSSSRNESPNMDLKEGDTSREAIVHDLSKEKAASHLENDANMYMLAHIPQRHLISRKAKKIKQSRIKAIAKAVAYSRPSKTTLETGRSIKSTLATVQQQARALQSA